MFSKWFKKGEDPNEALQRIHGSIEMLDKRENLLRKKMDEQAAKAKECVKRKDKKRALQFLKRKKDFEKQLDKIAGQKNNLNQMCDRMEEQILNKEIFDNQVKTASTMKNMLGKNMTIDKVEDQLDDVRERMQDADDLGEVLAQGLGTGVDELDVEDDLDELQNQIDDELMNDIQMPATKIKGTGGKVKLPGLQKEADDDLAELEREMGLLS